MLTTLMVVGAILGWPDAPFGAMGLLLLVVPVTLSVVLFPASLGRWGRRATQGFPFPPWLSILLWPIGAALLIVGAIALVGDKAKLASIPLLVVGVMFWFVARQKRTIVACHMMPWLVILGLLGVFFGAAGFGIGALVRDDEPYAGVALLGLAALLGLMLLFPWLATCLPGARFGRMPPGLRLLLLSSYPVLIFGAILLIVHGLPRPGDPVVAAVEQPDTSPAQPADPVPDPGADTVAKEPDVSDTEGEADAESADATPADSVPQGPGPVIASNQTYYLQMSDGRQFPVYRFIINGEVTYGIVVDRPETCWILQYDVNDADLIGECVTQRFEGAEPQLATVLFDGESRYVLGVRVFDALVVGDDVAQGFEADLLSQTIADVVVDDGQVEIGGERFIG